jgi:hypothetical protein
LTVDRAEDKILTSYEGRWGDAGPAKLSLSSFSEIQKTMDIAPQRHNVGEMDVPRKLHKLTPD